MIGGLVEQLLSGEAEKRERERREQQRKRRERQKIERARVVRKMPPARAKTAPRTGENLSVYVPAPQYTGASRMTTDSPPGRRTMRGTHVGNSVTFGKADFTVGGHAGGDGVGGGRGGTWQARRAGAWGETP
eukprot:9500296-Pyramimonas_sp.AAC.1